VTALAALSLIAAAPASAATPRQIYRDFADNGRLDHRYTRSDLQRALDDAAIQGYGAPGVVVMLKPAVEKQLRRPNAGVLATAHSQSQAGGRAVVATGRGGPLPFTGFDLWLISLGGGGLLLAGAVLRRLGRSGT
jgi:hypothetical protein